MLRTHRSLEAYCATLSWRWLVFSFFLVMEHRWNEVDRGKPKYSGKNLSQCHFIHHKSHMDWPGIEPRPPRWEAGNYPPEPWHGVHFNVTIPSDFISVLWSFPNKLLYTFLTSRLRALWCTCRRDSRVETMEINFQLIPRDSCYYLLGQRILSIQFWGTRKFVLFS
jgi:hypothetical protein